MRKKRNAQPTQLQFAFVTDCTLCPSRMVCKTEDISECPIENAKKQIKIIIFPQKKPKKKVPSTNV